MTAQTNQEELNVTKSKNNVISLIAPVLCLLLGFALWRFYMGSPSGFTNPDPAGGFWPHHKGPKGAFNKMYEGGIIVPILIALFFIVFTFVLERFFTINKAAGSGNAEIFIKKVQYFLAQKNIDAAFEECDKHKGSVANIMRAGLTKYQEMSKNKELDHEHKILAIKAEIEEATALELPMLEKNLVFLSTIASVATLVGLLGTVVGMIRAFSALGEEGGAGAAASLAAGISEALYNTALGIGTSAVAIIFYNIFTTKIEGITYAIDETSFTLAQTFDNMYHHA